MKPLYKSESWKKALLDLYGEKLWALDIPFSETFVQTSSGKTHVLIAGAEGLPPVVLIHGVTASAPIALEPIKRLAERFRIFAIDCVGAPTPSAETRLSMFDDGYGKWLTEALDGLRLGPVPFIAASYGAFVLHRLIAHNPRRVGAALFVVPAGFANGSFWKSLVKVILPMMKYMRTQREADLVRFMEPFFTRTDAYSIAWQKAALNGINMDLRKPPTLTEREAAGFDGPVYMLAAEDDLFFPAEKGIARCRKLFKGFRQAVILEGAKHVPGPGDYPRIERLVGEWLDAVVKDVPVFRNRV